MRTYTVNNEMLLRKITHSDKSISRKLAIKTPEGIKEIKLLAKQYNELKKIGCFQIAETDYSTPSENPETIINH